MVSKGDKLMQVTKALYRAGDLVNLREHRVNVIKQMSTLQLEAMGKDFDEVERLLELENDILFEVDTYIGRLEVREQMARR